MTATIGTVYFIDEDYPAYDPWIAELRLRDLSATPLRSADQAFQMLCDIPRVEVSLVIIDVMLAVDDVNSSRFSVERTDRYLETGLVLLDELAQCNDRVFPCCAALLTNTANPDTYRHARAAAARHGIPLWDKPAIDSPLVFGDRVVERIAEVVCPGTTT